MTQFTYASIVPLIGGETFGMERAFGKRPEYILSYSPFVSHDAQLLNYYNNEVPYYLINEGQAANRPSTKINVVNAVCPCAGLSALSPSSNSNHNTNNWMIESAEFVLSQIQPDVMWGENAPRLASKMGEPIVAKLRKVAAKHGYTLSLYKTKSILHGLSQVRDRAFYFFWRGDRIPVLGYYRRPHERIEDTILKTVRDENDPMSVLTNTKTPTDNPYYRYVLEVIHDGMTHAEFQHELGRSNNPMTYLEDMGHNYERVGAWMSAKGFTKEALRCEKIHAKLMAGGNIMRKTTEIPKDYIGAFVGHLPMSLTHPVLDRYLTIRECLNIMAMPPDFSLLEPKKNLNMICQNVPVSTAADMAHEVKCWLEGTCKMVDADFLIQDNKTQSMICDEKVTDLSSFLG